MREPSPQDKKGRKRSTSDKRRKRRQPRRRLPNLDNNSIHQQHHQVRAMQEHRHMPNYKHIMKEYQDKVASIQFRHDMLQRQKNANYQNEYNRLRGHLEHTVVRGENLHRLQHRMAELKSMLHEGLN
jgi:predicted RNase H-like nuclease (RuvC/YqgF family)